MHARTVDTSQCLERTKSWQARRAYFSYGGLGAFQGKLKPISSKTIYETCAVPILLYGCENWILTDSQLDRLEAFQGERGNWKKNSETQQVPLHPVHQNCTQVAIGLSQNFNSKIEPLL